MHDPRYWTCVISTITRSAELYDDDLTYMLFSLYQDANRSKTGKPVVARNGWFSHAHSWFKVEYDILMHSCTNRVNCHEHNYICVICVSHEVPEQPPVVLPDTPQTTPRQSNVSVADCFLVSLGREVAVNVYSPVSDTPESAPGTSSKDVTIGCFVVAMYDDQWYLGMLPAIVCISLYM